MFTRASKTEVVEEAATREGDLAVALAHDRKFRRQVAQAVREATQDEKFKREIAVAVRRAAGTRRTRPRVGTLVLAARLAADENVRRTVSRIAADARHARMRAENKRSRRVRNWTLLATAGAGVVTAVPQARSFVMGQLSRFQIGRRPRVITDSIEVDVPVSSAYNQWTQFEEFPRFMEGVEEVRQLDDTRLHWIASVAGKRAEWDAKILEQHPDRQISWVSEDGKTTRGTVSFEQVAPSRTRIELSMSYFPEGAAELVGSAAGLDARRVRGDLERFKQLIESRGTESGAWRGDVSGGETS